MMRDRRGTKKSNTVVQGIVANPLAAANAILHCDYGHFGVSPFHTISSARSPCGILFTALGNHPSFRRLGRNTVCAVCLASSISQALASCIQSPLKLSHFNHYACRSTVAQTYTLATWSSTGELEQQMEGQPLVWTG